MRALPHSRQHLFWRGVINPQNGHILCALKVWPSGLGVARELINKSAMKASFLRKGLSSRRKLGAIDLPYATSPCAGIASNEPGESSFSVGNSGTFRMTPRGSTILCRIAHILRRLAGFARVHISVCALGDRGSEQFRPAIASRWGDHDCEDEHFFSLFQVI